jgi:hypothetical protein
MNNKRMIELCGIHTDGNATDITNAQDPVWGIVEDKERFSGEAVLQKLVDNVASEASKKINVEVKRIRKEGLSDFKAPMLRKAVMQELIAKLQSMVK